MADGRKRFAFIRALRGLLGFASIAVALSVWSVARGGTPFWVQQTINYGGIRPAFAGEIGARLIGWLELLPYFFGPIIGVVTVIGAIILLASAFTRGMRTRAAAIDLFLLSYVLGFFALHWLLAFPVWDRYLLILVPVGSILLGRAVGKLMEHIDSRSQITIGPAVQLITLGAFALFMLPASLQAARSELPVGGDHGPHDGIDRVADTLRALPMGTVVYDHWLGWESDFYLWGAALYRAYFDTPSDLARDLHVFGRASTRYVVVPAGESIAKIERAISAQGFGLARVLTTTDRFGQNTFTVYQITHQTSEASRSAPEVWPMINCS